MVKGQFADVPHHQCQHPLVCGVSIIRNISTHVQNDPGERLLCCRVPDFHGRSGGPTSQQTSTLLDGTHMRQCRWLLELTGGWTESQTGEAVRLPSADSLVEHSDQLDVPLSPSQRLLPTDRSLKWRRGRSLSATPGSTSRSAHTESSRC